MQQQLKVVKLAFEGKLASFLSLDGQSKICNWLYNDLLEKANQYKIQFKETKDLELAKTIYSERGLRNLLPSLKDQYPFLKSVHSSPLKNSALRLSSAIQAYQKGRKGKRKGLSGWPKFRSWNKGWFSLFYDEPNKGYKVEGSTLTLSLGMGEEKKRQTLSFTLKEAHLLKDKVTRNLRIICENGIYYAIFLVSTMMPSPKPIQKVISLDPNHKNFAYGVDLEGQAIEICSPVWLKKYDKRIDELKSKRDRCLKKSRQVACKDQKGLPTGSFYSLPSKRWLKFQKTLQKALRKRREQTKTFMYTLANKLCKNYDCIGIGDYTPDGTGDNKQMRRAMNNRSLIGRFKEILSWTAAKSGKTFMEFNEAGTTRTCCECDYVIPNGLTPKIRHWTCPCCQKDHIRDENASINGLKKILRDLKQKGETLVSSVPCSGLVSVEERWAWCVMPSGVFYTLRGQSSELFAASGN
jgi:putative transposase